MQLDKECSSGAISPRVGPKVENFLQALDQTKGSPGHYPVVVGPRNGVHSPVAEYRNGYGLV